MFSIALHLCGIFTIDLQIIRLWCCAMMTRADVAVVACVYGCSGVVQVNQMNYWLRGSFRLVCTFPSSNREFAGFWLQCTLAYAMKGQGSKTFARQTFIIMITVTVMYLSELPNCYDFFAFCFCFLRIWTAYCLHLGSFFIIAGYVWEFSPLTVIQQNMRN